MVECWFVTKRIVLALCLCAATSSLVPFDADAKTASLGPFGPEGGRMREQLWIVPGADPQVPLRATVFRPEDEPGVDTRRPLVIINHGTDPATREAVAMPVFYWLSRWFVERGYVVVLPQRRGVGATGGEFAEAFDSCSRPDHAGAGLAAAQDIAAVLAYMRSQPFIIPDSSVAVGVSTGGWASLALASLRPAGLKGVVSFAAGRGAYAWGQAGSICGKDDLLAAASAFASISRVPTLWLYARNDTYFPPSVAERLVEAWSEGGGSAELHFLPPYGREGHDVVNDRVGRMLWGDIVERFLAERIEPRSPQVSASYKLAD